MSIKNCFSVLALGTCIALLTACASQPAATSAPAQPATPVAPVAAAAPAPAANAEKDTADTLEKKFQDAAKSYRVVEKDGKTLYCKREKVMGSTIPANVCLTESQLRNQVETMEDARNRLRNNGRCTMGNGCGAGG
jgi:Skp family chaperone for outer membrane proteins